MLADFKLKSEVCILTVFCGYYRGIFIGRVDLSSGNIETILWAYKELNDDCYKVTFITIRCQSRIHSLK